ncbi:MAG: type II toxin-antitoxin system HicB family antitoxin [Hyphomicrobium sp.]
MAGKPCEHIAPGTLNSILTQAGLKPCVTPCATQSLLKKAGGNYSAYLPHLPGCVATGDTSAAVEILLREAIAFHIEGLREDGVRVSEPSSGAGYLDARVAGNQSCRKIEFFKIHL